MTIGRDHELLVSFAHGFHESGSVDDRAARPALWRLGPDGESVHRYRFPIDADDFDELACPVLGTPPAAGTRLERFPRFGFTGLAAARGAIYAGSWNGIYRLDPVTLVPTAFLTNRTTCYLHRFHADEESIAFVMPFRDLVVIMDHDGAVIDRFSIDRRLDVRRDLPDDDTDWRFVAKPWSGSTGFFHVNAVFRVNGTLHLLSRHLGAFIVVEPGAKRAELRTLGFATPTCVHDGDPRDGRFHLTSIDGKILIASEPPPHDEARFHYDLQVECIRLDEIEKNWCRGMEVTDEHMYTTIDGRYGSDLSFGLLQLDRAGRLLDERRFRWSAVGDESAIRYVTGFDILARSPSGAAASR